jgi:O-antigen/teichoic acid export membrane protein
MTLISSVDILMVGFFLEPESVGFYRSVHPLRKITELVLRSFGFLFLPLATEYYSKGELGELRMFYRISTKWIALITLPFVLVFTLYSSDVVRVFLDPEYLSGASVLSILTAGLFFNALVGANGAMTKAINRPRIELYAASVGVGVNIVLNVLLIPVVGIVGAAIATVLGFAIYNIAEIIAIYYAVGVHPFSQDSILPLSITTVVGVTIAWMTEGMEFGLLTLIAIGIVFCVIQTVVVVITGSVSETDKKLFKRAKRRITQS